jgi:antirestriction protein ArdC
MKREPMTAEKAIQFGGHSTYHAAVLAAAAHARGCDCQAYEQWFTYARWQALGYQVKKGEHGVKLGCFIEAERAKPDGTIERYSRPWKTTVFCMHQVEPIKAK